MQTALFTSAKTTGSDDWATPSTIYNQIIKWGWFDPCPLGGKGGLECDWQERTYINPPYSQLKKWVNYGIVQYERYPFSQQLWLIPARTDTKAFQSLSTVATEFFS